MFELTYTKAEYWHRGCKRPECQGRDLQTIVTAHVVPAGFEVVRDGGNFIALDGPGISAGSTNALFSAVSGRASRA